MKKVFLITLLALFIMSLTIAMASSSVAPEKVTCPTCKMEMDANADHPKLEGLDGSFQFCGPKCAAKFKDDPTAFVTMDKLKDMGIVVKDGKIDAVPGACKMGTTEEVQVKKTSDIEVKIESKVTCIPGDGCESCVVTEKVEIQEKVKEEASEEVSTE